MTEDQSRENAPNSIETEGTLFRCLSYKYLSNTFTTDSCILYHLSLPTIDKSNIACFDIDYALFSNDSGMRLLPYAQQLTSDFIQKNYKPELASISIIDLNGKVVDTIMIENTIIIACQPIISAPGSEPVRVKFYLRGSVNSS